MYIPPAFAETDRDTLRDLMREHPFALLISQSADAPLVTHLPLVLDTGAAGNGVLYGHMARANPHWRALEDDPAVVAVFSGPHAYVSPSWYENHPAVPTWNYVAVHAHGRAETIHDPDALAPLLERMVAEFETGDGAWRFEDQPADFRQRQMKGIVGFRIAIERLEGKIKLSQNRPAEAVRVAAALDARQDAESHATAAAMRRFGVVE
jgi:transcriptional regulator